MKRDTCRISGEPLIELFSLGDLHVSDFLPHTTAWVRSFYALHEWIGLLAYRFGACAATPLDTVSTPP